MNNNVILIGRLTAEPEITTTESGKKVCNINLAVQRAFKNSDGLYEADFIRCILWDAIAERVCEYSHKGDLVSVRGEIRNSSYMNSNNEKKYISEVIVERLSFLSSKLNKQETVTE